MSEREYREEAERIISNQDAIALQEILKVRDAACALYAVRTLQTTENFSDSEVVYYLDQETRQPWAQFRKVLERIVADFETDFVLDGVVVDDPYPTHKIAWELARTALSLPNDRRPW